MEKRKNILIVILIAISVISIWININLYMKLEQSFKENEKYLIEHGSFTPKFIIIGRKR